MYDESNDGKGGMRQHLGMLQDLLSSLFERRSEANVVADARSLDVLCEELLTGKGEVSGYRLAQIILGRIDALDDQEISEFFLLLTNRFDIDAAAVLEAGDRYRQERSAENLAELMAAAEPKRQELLRRLNQFPGATARLVALREKLLAMAKSEAALNRVDLDFQRLFNSWFNRGFLVLRRIDWQTPANILEKIIQYEAVHEIDDWEDLRRRLQPEDRRCYGFFHPSMPNDPLIFVEVALSDDVPSSIQAILSTDRDIISQDVADTAVFYSISNCQKGLQGISFGNFLIKQVVQNLKDEFPNVKRFITLSPAPKFLTWLERQAGEDHDLMSWVRLARAGDIEDTDKLKRQAAAYLFEAKTAEQTPMDPVARFHLHNGALIDNVHADADVSKKGLEQSAGIMVNYLYDLEKIEQNHEFYAAKHKIAISSRIKTLLAASGNKKRLR